MKIHIDQLLIYAAENEASDVHIVVGRPPVFRINGVMMPQSKYPILVPELTKELFLQLAGEKKLEILQQIGEIDFAYSIHGIGRFRVNSFYQRGSISIILRLINSKIPTIEELNLPDIIVDLTNKRQGLLLVTGPTGSGKSTTLAAMIDRVNMERAAHILTLEDPIEYMHQHKNSIVTQREIGSDSKSFASALRAALRQDPDVILVGEMRDLETISTALTAAETGHLVLATLHTSSAAKTIDRIIDVFPCHQQQQVRAQQLLPRSDGLGRVAALEILISTPAIRNLIREGKTHQINSSIQTGAKFGMQTMEMALRNLYQSGLISHENYIARSERISQLI